MTLELSIVISVLSVSFALYSGISNLKRNEAGKHRGWSVRNQI